jgi:D-alanine-D-alanine ligase
MALHPREKPLIVLFPSNAMNRGKTSCVVLFNLVGEDEFERLRQIDPATLPFKPRYPIHVHTAHEEYEAVGRALEAENFAVSLLNIEDNLARLYGCVGSKAPDVVFNLVELFLGESRLEAAVTGLLELCAIPYTGADPFALTLCRRKSISKQIFQQQRIPTPRFRVLRTPKVTPRHGLRYPIMVKPAGEDASLGIEPGSVVHDLAQLRERVEKVFAIFGRPVMIEEFIEGRELHVAILGNSPPVALPILEYDFSALPEDHPSIITYAVKWNPLEPSYHSVHACCPADLPASTAQEVERLALRAYLATHCRDYARVDIRLSKDAKPFVLEVNPNPDLTEGVSFMESAEHAGLSFSQTLLRIVNFALARGR